MASVDVTSWQEFLTAASGNDRTLEINLPENAVWDLAEIEPEGHSGMINLCGKINGNGTQIKNLVLQRGLTQYQYTFWIKGTITDLHFINCHVITGEGLVGFSDSSDIFQLCTISAVVSGGGTKIFGGNGGSIYRCALNLEWADAYRVFLVASNFACDYLNAKISSSVVSEIVLNNQYSSYVNNSYFILDTPMVTTITGIWTQWCVIRCTGSNVTSLSSFTATYFCLAVETDFPNVSTIPSGIKFVSEPQLRDAAYLQSIGFPIGV